MRAWIVIGLMVIGSQALAQVDLSCVSDCMNDGKSMGYCHSQCGGDSETAQGIMKESNPFESSPNFFSENSKKVDLACVSECTDKGYFLSMCNKKCSY